MRSAGGHGNELRGRGAARGRARAGVPHIGVHHAIRYARNQIRGGRQERYVAPIRTDVPTDRGKDAVAIRGSVAQSRGDERHRGRASGRHSKASIVYKNILRRSRNFVRAVRGGQHVYGVALVRAHQRQRQRGSGNFIAAGSARRVNRKWRACGSSAAGRGSGHRNLIGSSRGNIGGGNHRRHSAGPYKD